MNEFSSAVRRGDGVARANARDFVRGLFEADGTLPQARGVAFTTGVSQRTPDLSTYKTNLQGWLQDAAFWNDMSAYVSDFSQENYADLRSYAVAGVPLPTRRDLLNDYLQHQLRLPASGPDRLPRRARLPPGGLQPAGECRLGQWDFGFGWTMTPLDQMQDFVSAQTYALRYDGAARGGADDRLGLAWAPRNALGLSASETSPRRPGVARPPGRCRTRFRRFRSFAGDSGRRRVRPAGAERSGASASSPERA